MHFVVRIPPLVFSFDRLAPLELCHIAGHRLTMSSDQNFLPAASSSPFAHRSVKAFASSCVLMMSNPSLSPRRYSTDPDAMSARQRLNLAVTNGADSLAKAHARNRKLL